MTVVLVGLNHRTAPVEVRERYALPPAQWRPLDEKLVQAPGLDEAAIVSTCNRTELLAVAGDSDGAAERLIEFFGESIGDGSAGGRHFYELRDDAAVRHLFRVASSLDSMVLGEAQILGQLKDAYAAAVDARACGPILNRMFHRAFRTAKRVRTETGLGAAAVSVARVGVALAAEVFETFAGKQVLLVGAGDMAESALHGLREAGAREIAVLNRTLGTAERLADRLGGRAGPLDALEAELARADIALASVDVRSPLVTRDCVERALDGRSGRPLLLIDLGMPRNVDPGANEVDDAYVYDLDDLDAIAERGREHRRGAVPPAEAIVEEEVERFARWRAGLEAVPTIRALLQQSAELATGEARRTAARLPEATPEVRQALERMAEAIVAKLLHRPLDRLRGEAAEGGSPYFAEAVRELFGLAEEDE